MLVQESLTEKIIGAAIEVHRVLGGPGLLESAYEEALAEELLQCGLSVKRQVTCPINYKGKTLQTLLRIDLLVEDSVIIECKATTDHNPIFEAQCLTYLRLLKVKVGLVINFGQKFLKNGIHRVVN